MSIPVWATAIPLIHPETNKNIKNKKDSERFIKTIQNLIKIKPKQLNRLNIEVKKSKLKRNLKKGIF